MSHCSCIECLIKHAQGQVLIRLYPKTPTFLIRTQSDSFLPVCRWVNSTQHPVLLKGSVEGDETRLLISIHTLSQALHSPLRHSPGGLCKYLGRQSVLRHRSSHLEPLQHFPPPFSSTASGIDPSGGQWRSDP